MFKLSRISRTELLAARSADFAVDFHFSVLDNELCVSAGHNCIAELQKSVEADKLGVYLFLRDRFLFYSDFEFLTISILLTQSLF